MDQQDLASSRFDLPAFIAANTLFKELDDRTLQELAQDMQLVALSGGEILFREGDPGDALYIVTEGLLKAVITCKDCTEAVVGEIRPGELVGEMQVLTGGKRTAKVCAACDSMLAKLPKTAFDRMAEKAPLLVQAVTDMIGRRQRRNQLAAVLPTLFGELDETSLRDIEAQVESCCLQRGQALFRQGDHGDSLYIPVRGRLQAVVKDESGNEKIVGEIVPGETIGEMAIFTGELRSATVYATRDSVLVKFSKSAFEEIIRSHPPVMMALTKLLIDRLRRTITPKAAPGLCMSIAVVPTGEGVPLTEFTGRLATALSGFGSTLHLTARRVDSLLGIVAAQKPEDDLFSPRLAAWLDDQETNHRFVVYEADMFLSAWTKRCIRRADRILLVANARSDPQPGEIEKALIAPDKGITSAPRHLALLHRDGHTLPTKTREWLAPRQASGHNHIRLDSEADFARLARSLTGNAVGLALSGGGARGFAHIGVIRALQESGIPVDMVGGTSMGSLIAAQVAMGLDHEEMIETHKRTFLEFKPFSDYTLPLVSLLASRNLDRALEAVFGAVSIEDLWLNYFCISSNLTAAEMVTHREGLLWRAIRASVSLPGVTVPVLDGDNLLVDGGVLNNLPADVMRGLCGGPVIAVDITAEKDLRVDLGRIPSPWEALWTRISPLDDPINVPNIFAILMRTTMLNSISKTQATIKEADLYLRPPVDRFKMLDFGAIEEIVEAGYTYAREKIREWDYQTIINRSL